MKVRFFSLSLLSMAAHLLPDSLLRTGAAVDLSQNEFGEYENMTDLVQLSADQAKDKKGAAAAKGAKKGKGNKGKPKKGKAGNG